MLLFWLLKTKYRWLCTIHTKTHHFEWHYCNLCW